MPFNRLPPMRVAWWRIAAFGACGAALSVGIAWTDALLIRLWGTKYQRALSSDRADSISIGMSRRPGAVRVSWIGPSKERILRVRESGEGTEQRWAPWLPVRPEWLPWWIDIRQEALSLSPERRSILAGLEDARGWPMLCVSASIRHFFRLPPARYPEDHFEVSGAWLIGGDLDDHGTLVLLPYRPIPVGLAVNSGFYGFTVWFVVWALRFNRSRRRLRRGLCPACGYDVSAARVDVCAECGRAVVKATAMTAIETDRQS